MSISRSQFAVLPQPLARRTAPAPHGWGLRFNHARYDELKRLISAQTTNNTTWGLSWTYDGFGNRLSQGVTQGSAPINTVAVDASTNRIASSGYANDANGNMTAMPHGAGSMSLTYDHSNRLSNTAYPGGNTEDYRYAPDNRRIWRNKGRNSCQQISDDGVVSGLQSENATEQVIFYSPGGQKMGVYCVTFGYNASFPGTTHAGITASEENVYFGARLVAKRHLTQTLLTNGNTTSFDVDRLHSKGDGSKYFPYGENKGGGAADDREQFATYTRDQGTNLDYADQRYYASGLGRFTAPDPRGRSAKIWTASSWNRYHYASNNPTGRIDRRGLEDGDGDYDFDWCEEFPADPSCQDGPSREDQDPGSRTQGPGGGNSPDTTRLRDAFEQALEFLVGNDDCAKLFGTGLNPISVLTDLVHGNGPGHGSISFRILPRPGPGSTSVVAAYTSGILGSGNAVSNFVGANITINADSSAPWFSGYPDKFGLLTDKLGSINETHNAYRAITLLHELGHVLTLLNRNVLILDDQVSAEASVANTELVYKNCVKKFYE